MMLHLSCTVNTPYLSSGTIADYALSVSEKSLSDTDPLVFPGLPVSSLLQNGMPSHSFTQLCTKLFYFTDQTLMQILRIAS